MTLLFLFCIGVLLALACYELLILSVPKLQNFDEYNEMYTKRYGRLGTAVQITSGFIGSFALILSIFALGLGAKDVAFLMIGLTTLWIAGEEIYTLLVDRTAQPNRKILLLVAILWLAMTLLIAVGA